MKIEVDINLFNALIECIDKQTMVKDQPIEIQQQWNDIIRDTYLTAKATLQEHMKTVGHGDPRRTETGLGPMLSPSKTPYL